MVTEEQKEQLRKLGRNEGAMAYGRRMDKLDELNLSDAQWADAYAVWVKPGYPPAKFVCGPAHPDHVLEVSNVRNP
jgi:hypothetical protein